MNLFETIEDRGHEQIIFCANKKAGLRAIIAIHNTTLGPSLGGCRLWDYKTEEDALEDVLRLSRGMTYKSAIAGLNLGGGKAVIMRDSKAVKTEQLFRAFGRFVQSLGGRYITAEDVGTSVRDMSWVHMETDFVTGIEPMHGGSGDPSPVTAHGVFCGIQAALKWHFGSNSLKGKKIGVQGLGKVGMHLVDYLVKSESTIFITDIDDKKIKKAINKYPQITYLNEKDFFDREYDIYAPCALGGTINSETINNLKCHIIAGCANNQLLNEKEDIHLLQKRNILYIPDFVINSGGLINVANELSGYNREIAFKQTANIYNNVMQVLSISGKENITTLEAANKLAIKRIEEIGSLKKSHLGVLLQKRGREV